MGIPTEIEARSCDVLVEHGVGHIVWRNCDVCGAFNHWIVGDVQINVRVVQVSTAELTAGHVDRAVLAVPEADRLLDWPDDESSILTAVDCDLHV